MKIWAVTTQKGGSGKTTIALHLAIVAAQNGLKTVVIDVDPQQSAAKWAMIRGLDKPKVVTCIVPDLRRLLARLQQEQYDLAVIDTSPRADRDNMDVIAQADVVVVPVRPSILDLPAVEATLRHIESSGRLKRTAVVLNAVPPRTDEGEQAARILRKMGPLLAEQIAERVDYRRALTGGRGVTEFAPSSQAAKEVKALYKALEQHQVADS